MKKVSINPVAFLIWLWLIVVGGVMYAINYALVILLHEIGHYYIAKAFGYKLSAFSLSPYGIALSYYDVNLDKKDEFWIALAGPAVNIVSGLMMLGVLWLIPASYFFLQSFVEISLIIALFNLLPAYPLDGGRMFICFFNNIFKMKTARKITIFFNVVLMSFFAFCFIICCFVSFNPTLALFAVFLAGGMIDLKHISKYEKVNIFCKKTKNFAKPTIYCVDPGTTIFELVSKIQTTKTCVFCLVLDNGKVVNLSENFVQKLATRFDIKTKLSEIIKNTSKQI